MSTLGPTKAQTFTSTARGGFTIFMLGNTAQEKRHGGLQEHAFSLRSDIITKFQTGDQRGDDVASVRFGRLGRLNLNHRPSPYRGGGVCGL